MAVAPTRTDAALVRRLQGRDRAAWGELYAEYQPRLRAFGYRLAGNAHDADDLVQETFVRALPALDRLDADGVDLTAYLFATTKNLFLKQVERGTRAEPTAEVPEPDVPQPIEDDPERSALLHRQQEEVRVANARLDPRQRLVLALCELEDRSYAEIGELVGLNENAVAQLVFRARERLRTELRLVQVDPERLPEECRAFLPLLAQHLDGKPRGPKQETTLAHLEQCERCQAALGDMREAKRRYRALLLPPLGMPAEEARAAVDEELEQVGYWRGAGGRRTILRRPRGAAAIVAVAALVALCVGGGLGAATLLAERSQRVAAERRAETTVVEPTTEPSASAAASVTTPASPVTTTPEKKPKPKPAPTPPATTSPAEKPTTTPIAKPPATEPATVAPETAEPLAPASTEETTTTPRPESPAPPPVRPDRTAPRVSITDAVLGVTPDAGSAFTFSADETGVVFTCRLDAGAWEPCTSPRRVESLALGPHAFAVRARDRAGNTGAAATRSWTVSPPPDTTAPTVTFTQVPPAASTARSATFGFTASEPGVTFACSYDGGPFAVCQSPHTIPDAGADDHSLAVRATDAAGNTGSPGIATWTVLAPLPDLVAELTDRSVTVRNAGEGAAAPSLVDVAGIGTFSIPSLQPGQAVTRTFTCRRGTLVAAADYARAVAESNEDNNTATRVASCV